MPSDPAEPPAEEALDPVCGATIDPRDDVHVTEYDDRIVRFCSSECLLEFEDDPDRWLEDGSFSTI
jgi:Cu+-exporting ATPase